MSYVEKHLIEGETVVYKTRMHWIVLVVPVVGGLLIGLPGLALVVRFSTGASSKSVTSESMMVGGAVLLVFALVCIALGILSRNATEMTGTSNRSVGKVGVFARRTIEMLLSRVESIGLESLWRSKSPFQGMGCVRGTGGTPESFD